ncbi:class D sortase [Candidatus Roizmanbacteria bacterium]|nr:class D sortase [Candidatus Roizmanbacteria bacterium]
MAIHIYTKEYFSVKKKVVHTVSYLSLISGSLLLFWSFYPILSFELYSRLFIQRDILSPVPASKIASSLNAANALLGSYNVYSSNLRDFVQANLWFPSMPQGKQSTTLDIKEYAISIPKLNITDAKVVIGGDDLSKSLIHYLPTSLPGELGNVAIFGHSTLPQLYNTKDYKTIFTYLPSLNKGDTVVVTVGETEYEYEVYDMFVVKPEQVSVLEQKFDGSYLTLITCVPPGTYWNRLVVKAKLKAI